MGSERSIRERWRHHWHEPRFRWATGFAWVFFVATLTLAREVLNFVETRKGAELPDPVLAAFAPVDLTWLIFFLIWGPVLFALFIFSGRPRRFVITLQAYSVMLNMRLLTLWLTPLAAPESMLTLHDPIVDTFVQVSEPLTQDLFFSGHTSTPFLFFLAARKGWEKALLLAATLLVGTFLILQHAHYTVDIVAAPFFAAGSYRFVQWLWRRGEAVK